MDESLVRQLFHAFYQLFPNASSVAISDTTQFIYYKPGVQIDLKIKPGDPVYKDTATFKALQEKRKVKEYNNNKMSGLGYYAISQPIMKKQKLIGAVTAIFLQDEETLSIPCLTVKTSDRWVPIHFKNIIFVEAQNRKTHVISKETKGTHRHNLTELENLLPKNTFVRCHRSYIINLYQIKEIHPDLHSTFILIMSDDSRVPVSQSYVKGIRKILGF